jgi:hypothetical protein
MDPVVALKGVLPPVALALLLVSLLGVRLLPIAVAGGLFAAYALLKAWPALPHRLWAEPNGTEWLLWAVAAAAFVALADHSGRLGRAGAALGALCGACGAWLVLQKVASNWDPSAAALHVGGAGLAVALVVLGQRRALAKAPANVFPAVLFTAVLSLDAALLTLGKSALLGQLCGAAAAALGAAAGTVLWRRPVALRAADATWFGAAHGLFLLAGVHLAALPWPVAVCALFAPVAPAVLRAPLAARPRTWAFAATALVMAPMAAAMWLAVANYDSGY